MGTFGSKIQNQYLLKIKKIVDSDVNGDKFIIKYSDKNRNFMRNYGINIDEVKDIIRGLTVKNCFDGLEFDRNPKYDGLIFKFDPVYNGIKLYIKIRVESDEKSICMSIHENGLYD